MKFSGSVAQRLALAFLAVILGLLLVALVSLTSLNGMQRGMKQVTDELTPVTNQLNALQLELLNLSVWVSEYFQAEALPQAETLRENFQQSRAAFSERESGLQASLAKSNALADSALELADVGQSLDVLFSSIEANMDTYAATLNALQDIETKRQQLVILNEDIEYLMRLFVQDTFDPFAKELVYEAQILTAVGSSQALQIVYTGNSDDLDNLIYLFDEFVGSWEALAVRMQAWTTGDPIFESNLDESETQVNELIELISGDSGISQIKQNYLTTRANLLAELPVVRSELQTKVDRLQQLASGVTTLVAQETDKANATSATATYTVTIASIILVVASVLIGVIVVLSIRRPLAHLSGLIAGVEQGDLTRQVTNPKSDEIGLIGRAMNNLVNALRGVIGDIERQSGVVSDVVKTTQSLTTETQRNAQQQQEDIVQLSTSLDEMAGAIKNVAATSEQTSQQMSEGKQEAEEIQRAITAAVQLIVELNQDMQSAVDVIKNLDDSVTSIETILETIQTIAEQTNLLALNAAIEAARAGEQGRGFAVVADEVRTLATRTQTSTEEIRQKIEGIQQQSGQAVQVISSSQASTENVAQQTQTAGERFGHFMEEIQSLNEANLSIASTAEEQNATTQQMTALMHTIADMTEKNALVITEVAERIISLNQAASDLQKAVHRFEL